MSRECIRNCPRIAEILDDMDMNNLLAGPSAFHPDIFADDDSSTNQLLSMCEASYECLGPTIQPVDVIKGFFKRRVQSENQLVCGYTPGVQDS